MSANKLRDSRVVGFFPHACGRNQRVPRSLLGATIVKIGTFADAELVEGGGLVIDYRAKDSAEIQRVVLAFDEVAMWMEAEFP